MLNFASTIQFLGGTRTLDFLRGQAYGDQGNKGHLSGHNVNLFLPSPSPILEKFPLCDPYRKIDIELVETVKAALYRKGSFTTAPTAGISFDEMEVMAGLTLSSDHTEAYGAVSGPLLKKNACKTNWMTMRAHLATHILQLFVTLTDGSATFPVGFIPSRGMQGKEIASIVKELVGAFAAADEQHPIKVIWVKYFFLSSFFTFFFDEVFLIEFERWAP